MQNPLGSVFVELGPQKRSLAAGACAVDPIFSLLSSSPLLHGSFCLCVLWPSLSCKPLPCDPTSCNFPQLVQSPPSESSPYAIIYDSRAEMKHTSKLYDAAPLNDRLVDRKMERRAIAAEENRKPRKRRTTRKKKEQNRFFRPQKPPKKVYAAVWRGCKI